MRSAKGRQSLGKAENANVSNSQGPFRQELPLAHPFTSPISWGLQRFLPRFRAYSNSAYWEIFRGS